MKINLTKLLEIKCRVTYIIPTIYGTTGWVGIIIKGNKTGGEEPYSFELDIAPPKRRMR